MSTTLDPADYSIYVPEFLATDSELTSKFMQVLLKFEDESELDFDAYISLCTRQERVFTETQFREMFQGVYVSTAEFAQDYAFAIDHELGVLIFR